VTQVRVREVLGTMRIVDGESLLTGRVVERLVTAVMEAMEGSHRDERARRRDTRIGGSCCSGCAHEESR
jgi:hypothetical protein